MLIWKLLKWPCGTLQTPAIYFGILWANSIRKRSFSWGCNVAIQQYWSNLCTSKKRETRTSYLPACCQNGTTSTRQLSRSMDSIVHAWLNGISPLVHLHILSRQFAQRPRSDVLSLHYNRTSSIHINCALPITSLCTYSLRGIDKHAIIDRRRHTATTLPNGMAHVLLKLMLATQKDAVVTGLRAF